MHPRLAASISIRACAVRALLAFLVSVTCVAAARIPAAAAQTPAVPADSLFAPDTLATAPDDSLARATAAPDSAPPAPRDYLAEVRAGFTPENRAYSNIRLTLLFLDPLYALLAGMFVLFSGLSAAMRDIAHQMGRRLYVRVLVYFTLYSLLAYVLVFPLEWYRGFALEHQFGLSTESFTRWLGHQGTALAVSIAALGIVPLLALVYYALEKSPKRWWLWLAAGTVPVTVITVLIAPIAFDPLFNHFGPLRDTELRTEILDLAARAGIPSSRVFEVDMSAETRKLNAYVTGFGTSQRIVLYDTVLGGMPHDEILFIVGHEIGHYRLGHIWKGIALSGLGAFAFFWIYAYLARRLLARFGRRWGVTALHDVASLPMLLTLLSLMLFAVQPVTNWVSRRTEHEADVFALDLTHDNDAGARAFIALAAANKSDPEPAALVKWLFYTHPPLAERVRFALEYRPWETGHARAPAPGHGVAADR